MPVNYANGLNCEFEHLPHSRLLAFPTSLRPIIVSTISNIPYSSLYMLNKCIHAKFK